MNILFAIVVVGAIFQRQTVLNHLPSFSNPRDGTEQYAPTHWHPKQCNKNRTVLPSLLGQQQIVRQMCRRQRAQYYPHGQVNHRVNVLGIHQCVVNQSRFRMNLDGKFQDGVRVHQRAGHFSQEHEDHGALMSGTLQQRRGHVERRGKVMTDEHEVGTAQHGLAGGGIPRIDAQHDGIVQHVSRAEVDQCLGGILPPDGRVGHLAAGPVRRFGGEQARTQ